MSACTKTADANTDDYFIEPIIGVDCPVDNPSSRKQGKEENLLYLECLKVNAYSISFPDPAETKVKENMALFVGAEKMDSEEDELAEASASYPRAIYQQQSTATTLTS
ncbi:hypothetical protein KIN20_008914 [Parelaphostrongylus tenuis]|uniref:Uncharacterized protein n=1 Tax=Parelaphostrongylus tenuis TaxID=148309 RepID=A0AAD5QKV5_PARTN|nr:hypothetical protein KIN20_008914 [Parelaphostrongylus tenuis]